MPGRDAEAVKQALRGVHAEDGQAAPKTQLQADGWCGDGAIRMILRPRPHEVDGRITD